MGLYLAVFDGDDELDGVEVGLYADFEAFRSAVAAHFGDPESLFPTLMLHSDCDGEWSPDDAVLLQSELTAITEKFMELPPESLGEGWKPEVTQMLGLQPNNLYDCFFDVDGEPLIDRIMGLAQLGVDRNVPILFQ